MVLDQTANFVRGAVTEDVSSSENVISVADASIYPDPSSGRGEYNVVIWDSDQYTRPDLDADAEILRVTGRDTTNDTITVTRGQEGTAASSHPSSSEIHLPPTSKIFDDIDTKITSSLTITGSNGLNAGSAELGGTINLGISGTLSLDDDLEAVDGEIIWDESNTWVPQDVLENDRMTIAGNSVALGGSTAINHSNISNINSDDHHSKYTDSEAVSAVDGASLSHLNFDNNEAGDYTNNGDIFYDQSAGLYVYYGSASSSPDGSQGAGLLWNEKNVTTDNAITVTTDSEGEPTLGVDSDSIGSGKIDLADDYTWSGVHTFTNSTEWGSNSDFSLFYESSSDELVLKSSSVELIRQPTSGPTQFLQGADIGSIEAPEDSLTQIINAPSTSAASSGDTVGYTFAIDNLTGYSLEGTADGSGGISSLDHRFVDSSGSDILRANDDNTVNTPNGQLSEMGDRVATRVWVGNNYDDFNKWTAKDGDGSERDILSGETLQIRGGSQINTNIASGGSEVEIDINHSNTTAQGDVTTGGATVIDDIGIDGNGHVTNLNTEDRTLDDWSPPTSDLDMNQQAVQNFGSIEMDGDISGGGVDISITEVTEILGPNNGDTALTLKTQGSGSHRVRLYDSANNQIILDAKEGGFIDIPNGALNVEGDAQSIFGNTSNSTNIPVEVVSGGDRSGIQFTSSQDGSAEIGWYGGNWVLTDGNLGVQTNPPSYAIDTSGVNAGDWKMDTGGKIRDGNNNPRLNLISASTRLNDETGTPTFQASDNGGHARVFVGRNSNISEWGVYDWPDSQTAYRYLESSNTLELTNAHVDANQHNVANEVFDSPSADTVFTEGFERYSSISDIGNRWSLNDSSGTNSFVAGYADRGYAVHSEETSSGGEGLQFSKQIPDSEVVAARCRVYLYNDKTQFYDGIPTIRGDATLSTHIHGNGNLQYTESGGGRTTITTLPIGEWVELLWIVDANRDQFTVFVNGERYDINDLSSFGSSFDNIKFRANKSGDHKWDLDDIAVSAFSDTRTYSNTIDLGGKDGDNYYPEVLGAQAYKFMDRTGGGSQPQFFMDSSGSLNYNDAQGNSAFNIEENGNVQVNEGLDVNTDEGNFDLTFKRSGGGDNYIKWVRSGNLDARIGMDSNEDIRIDNNFGDNIYLETGGSKSLTIGSSQNVTVNSGDLYGDNNVIRDFKYIRIGQNDSDPLIEWQSNGTSKWYARYNDSNSQLSFIEKGNNNVVLQLHDNQAVKIPNNSLSVNTTGTSGALEVNGDIYTTGNNSINFNNNNVGLGRGQQGYSAGDMVVWAYHDLILYVENTDTEILHGHDTGDVDIPNGKLNVDGIIDARGTTPKIRFGDLDIEASSSNGKYSITSSGGDHIFKDNNDLNLLKVKEGGNVEIPNGNLSVSNASGSIELRDSTTNPDPAIEGRRDDWDSGDYFAHRYAGSSGGEYLDFEFYDSSAGTQTTVVQYNADGQVDIPNGRLGIQTSSPSTAIDTSGVAENWRIQTGQSIEDGDGEFISFFNSSQKRIGIEPATTNPEFRFFTDSIQLYDSDNSQSAFEYTEGNPGTLSLENATLNMSSHGVTQIDSLRGDGSSTFVVRGNNTTTQSTEQNISIQTLDSGADTWVTGLLVKANGSSSNVEIPNGDLDVSNGDILNVKTTIKSSGNDNTRLETNGSGNDLWQVYDNSNNHTLVSWQEGNPGTLSLDNATLDTGSHEINIGELNLKPNWAEVRFGTNGSGTLSRSSAFSIIQENNNDELRFQYQSGTSGDSFNATNGIKLSDTGNVTIPNGNLTVDVGNGVFVANSDGNTRGVFSWDTNGTNVFRQSFVDDKSPEELSWRDSNNNDILTLYEDYDVDIPNGNLTVGDDDPVTVGDGYSLNNSTNTSYIQFTDGGNARYTIASENAAGGELVFYSDNDDIETFRVDDAGDVEIPNGRLGIQTSNPSTVLDTSGVAEDWRIQTGRSIEDGSGSRRVQITSSDTTIFNESGNSAFFAGQGAAHSIGVYSGTPFELYDNPNSQTAVEYTTGNPGTFATPNSVVDIRGASDGGSVPLAVGGNIYADGSILIGRGSGSPSMIYYDNGNIKFDTQWNDVTNRFELTDRQNGTSLLALHPNGPVEIDPDSDGLNLRIATGQAIEDGDGTTRIAFNSYKTGIKNESGKEGIELSDGARHKIKAYSGIPFVIGDEEGVFDAVKYTTSSSTPGTLSLPNASLGMSNNSISSVSTLNVANITSNNGTEPFKISQDSEYQDDVKNFYGNSKDFSQFYDSSTDELVVKDETNGVELIRQPKSGATQFLQGADIGAIEAPEDSLTQLINASSTSAASDGDKVGYTFAIDNKTAMEISAASDGSGGIDLGDFKVYTTSPVGNQIEALAIDGGQDVEIPNGSLGVNISQPSDALEVNGEIRTTGSNSLSFDDFNVGIGRAKKGYINDTLVAWSTGDMVLHGDSNNHAVLKAKDSGNVQIPNGNLKLWQDSEIVDDNGDIRFYVWDTFSGVAHPGSNAFVGATDERCVVRGAGSTESNSIVLEKGDQTTVYVYDEVDEQHEFFEDVDHDNNYITGKEGIWASYLSTSQSDAETGIYVNLFENIDINDAAYTRNSNTSIDIDKTGTYRVSMTVRIRREGSGARNIMELSLEKNGSRMTSRTPVRGYIRNDGSGDTLTLQLDRYLDLSSGDTLRPYVREVKGGETGNNIHGGWADIEFVR